jgi:hypothetical protein
MRRKTTAVMMALVLMAALTILSVEATLGPLNATNCRGSFPSDEEKLQVSKGRLTTVFGGGTASVTCSLRHDTFKMDPSGFIAWYEYPIYNTAVMHVHLDFVTLGGTVYYSPTYYADHVYYGDGPTKAITATGSIVNNGDPIEGVISVNAYWWLPKDGYIIAHWLAY